MDIAGRRVLITGASRGIGAALARGFALAGAEVALVARSADAIESLAGELGGRAYPGDLTDLAGIDDLVDRIESDGGIDILVNNAGVSNVGWYFDRTQDEIDQLMALNLLAPMRLVRRFVPKMIERGAGHVVNISSMAAIIAPPGLAAYGASKAGLSHFTAGLMADLRDDPIGLTTVHLGSVDTDMDEEARSYAPLRELAEKSAGRDITPMPVLVDAVLDGVAKNRTEVRVPKMMAPLAAATNLPRAVGRLIFKQSTAKQMRD